MPRNPLRSDPTRTRLLRQKFFRELHNRVNILQSRIYQLIQEENLLGRNRTLFVERGLEIEWARLTGAERLRVFERWMEEQLNQVLVPGGDRYWEKYVEESYEKGANRAFLDTNRGRLAATAVALGLFQLGRRSQFLSTLRTTQTSILTVDLLLERLQIEIRGLFDSISVQITREISTAFTSTDTISTILENLGNIFSRAVRRARTLSDTEVVRSHAEGQLDALDQLGVTQVGVLVEWVTAQDDRVCPLCLAMEGRVFPIEEARGLIPLHPNCRCAWVPVSPRTGIRNRRNPRISYESVRS